MQNVTIRLVEKHDLPLLDTALRALSKDLSDTHPASIAFLEQAGFGHTPAYYALIALTSDSAANADDLCGAIVFSPVMSTTLAATGFYVSDLWVADAARGFGVGRQLLAHAGDYSRTQWGARYLKLAVYDDSNSARQFYARLGLTARIGETTMFLDDVGLDALKGDA